MFICCALQFGAAVMLIDQISVAKAEVFNLPWNFHLVRLGVVVVLHNKTSPATHGATRTMKFTALNIENFKRPYMAFLIVALQFLQTIVIEAVNIWYILSQFTITSILWGYLAFSCILSFDEAFLIPFMDSDVKIFQNLHFVLEIFRKDKFIIRKEFKADELVYEQVKSKISEFVTVLPQELETTEVPETEFAKEIEMPKRNNHI